MNWNLNPFAALTWSWRALRGHSVTFAALFALGVLGLPVIGAFRHLLSRLGAPWYAWLLVPILAIAYLARKETQWMPEEHTRRRWARGIFFGSIVLALVWAKLGWSRREPPPEPAPVHAPVHAPAPR